MPRDTLTGSRIRERRVMAGIKQSDLAKHADISPSYLNLIEHNRRRIGGKLLVDIAQALGVEPTSLTEGAETTLLATLREAATGTDLSATELSRAEEFAGRFPGWARILANNQRKIETLQQSVEALTDRYASLVKVLDLDLMIINLAYGEERLERLSSFTGMSRKLLERCVTQAKK